MATVIYSNFQDYDTMDAHLIWDGLPDVKVIEVSETNTQEVESAMETEEDFIIFYGHGSPHGLFSPRMKYVVNQNNAHLVKAKNIIGIWCHASEFAMSHNWHGFFSGMFISNPIEALVCGIKGMKAQDIRALEVLFNRRLNKLLLDNTDINEIAQRLKEQMNEEDPVERYNYSRLVNL